MAGDAVAEVKSRLDLVEVIGGYVTLHRSGRELTGLCPFHAEKTPSFAVNPERQVWYCHGCDKGGDLFRFIEQIERIDFRQALEMLADRAGVELDSGPSADRGAGRRRRRSIELNGKAQAYYQHVLWATQAGERGRALLGDRGIGEQLARLFGIGFAPAGGAGEDALDPVSHRQGCDRRGARRGRLAHPPGRGRTRDRFRDRLVFPIRDERGEVLGFGARALGDAKPKYLNSPDSAAYHKSAAIFGIDLARTAIAAKHAAVIVEGYFDVIAAHAAGVEHTVASSGTALTREQVHSLSRIAETLILCFDGDDAGRVAATRAVDVIAAEGVQARICRLPAAFKDPDELVRSDPAAFAQAIERIARRVAGAPRRRPGLWRGRQRRCAAGSGGTSRFRACPDPGGDHPRAVSPASRPAPRHRGAVAEHRPGELDARRSAPAPQDPGRRACGDRAGRADESEPAEMDEPMPPWEAQLARVVMIRPELAAALRSDSGLGPDEFTNPTARRIYDAASSDPAGFTLRKLSGGDQRRAAGLLVREVPEFADEAEPQAIKQLMADCVRLIHEESVRRALVSISTEMHRARDEGRTADADALAAKLSRLAADAPHLRRTLAVR